MNRLVLGKACALVGALALGGYLGYALAQLGVADPPPTPGCGARCWRRSAPSPLTVAALLLELACRVPTGGRLATYAAPMAASRTPMRRRQRSVRVTVAVSLLSVASVAVLASLPAQSALWLGLASVSRPGAVVGRRCG